MLMLLAKDCNVGLVRVDLRLGRSRRNAQCPCWHDGIEPYVLPVKNLSETHVVGRVTQLGVGKNPGQRMQLVCKPIIVRT